MDYLILDRATGAIVSVGQDTPETAARQAGGGQMMLPFPGRKVLRSRDDEGRSALTLDMDTLRRLLVDLLDREAGAAAVAAPERAAAIVAHRLAAGAAMLAADNHEAAIAATLVQWDQD